MTQFKHYASAIDLNNTNQSWTRLIQWTGKNKRVLDVGCGRGQMGQLLNEHFGCIVTGLEYNHELAQEAKGYNKIIIGSAEDESVLSSIKDQFDIIICGDVLEHLRQPETPLNIFHQLLAANGRVLISVPNVAQIRIRLMLLRGRWDYTTEGIMDKTHLRWFTFETLTHMVKACGWQVADFDYTIGPNIISLLNRLHLSKSWIPFRLSAAQFLLNLSAIKS